MSLINNDATPSCSMDNNKTDKKIENSFNIKKSVTKIENTVRTESVIKIKNKYTTDNHSDDESTISGEPTELIEQVYQDDLDEIKNLLYQLENGTHPKYVEQLKELEDEKKKQLAMNNMRKDQITELINSEFNQEVRQMYKDFQCRSADITETLLVELKERKKVIKQEYMADDVSQDWFEKPVMTRKLRRRPNEPMVPIAKEKSRKPLPVSTIQYTLHEDEIDQDVKEIQEVLASMPSTSTTTTGTTKNCETVNPLSTKKSGVLKNLSTSSGYMSHKKYQDSKIKESSTVPDPRIEGGKLLYEKRWFHRGQPVFIEERQMTKIPAVIAAIGNESIWVKKTLDNSKLRVNLSHLINGKMSIKRRAN